MRNNLTRSLFYNKVLDVSCNLLNSVLKVKNRTAVRGSTVGNVLLGVDPCDLVADGELPLPPPRSIREDHTAYIASLVKDKNSQLDGTPGNGSVS